MDLLKKTDEEIIEIANPNLFLTGEIYGNKR